MKNNSKNQKSYIRFVINQVLCKLGWHNWDDTFSDMNQNCKRCKKGRYLDIHGDKQWHIIG